MKSKLSLTVGITTCYGDESILETVKSIRNSQDIKDFRFIIVADRVPISEKIKKELKKYKVELIENKVESGQMKKKKQILAKTRSDILLFTNDDVLLGKNAIKKMLERFERKPKTTLISIRNQPVKATSLFEEIISVGTIMAGKIAKYWNKGDNYLSVIGRFEAARVSHLKKFRIPTKIATSDAFLYFENKRLGGGYEYIPEVAVYFKNPQNMKEHLRKSSRFQFSKLEMSKYFKNLDAKYDVPVFAQLRAIFEEFVKDPVKFMLYIMVLIYTRIMRSKPKEVLDAVWEVDLSTKKILP